MNSQFFLLDKAWTLGHGCPVQGCGVKAFYNLSCLKTHWAEKHRETVIAYQCSACLYTSKRKRNVYRHYHQRHNLNGWDPNPQCVGDVVHQPNKGYVDPCPFTLEMLIAKYKRDLKVGILFV